MEVLSEQKTYNVEYVDDVQIRFGRYLVSIKWEGYPPDQNTWEPWHHLNVAGAVGFLTTYLRRIKNHIKDMIRLVGSSERLAALRSKQQIAERIKELARARENKPAKSKVGLKPTNLIPSDTREHSTESQDGIVTNEDSVIPKRRNILSTKKDRSDEDPESAVGESRSISPYRRVKPNHSTTAALPRMPGQTQTRLQKVKLLKQAVDPVLVPQMQTSEIKAATNSSPTLVLGRVSRLEGEESADSYRIKKKIDKDSVWQASDSPNQSASSNSNKASLKADERAGLAKLRSHRKIREHGVVGEPSQPTTFGVLNSPKVNMLGKRDGHEVLGGNLQGGFSTQPNVEGDADGGADLPQLVLQTTTKVSPPSPQQLKGKMDCSQSSSKSAMFGLTTDSATFGEAPAISYCKPEKPAAVDKYDHGRTASVSATAQLPQNPRALGPAIEEFQTQPTSPQNALYPLTHAYPSLETLSHLWSPKPNPSLLSLPRHAYLSQKNLSLWEASNHSSIFAAFTKPPSSSSQSTGSTHIHPNKPQILELFLGHDEHGNKTLQALVCGADKKIHHISASAAAALWPLQYVNALQKWSCNAFGILNECNRLLSEIQRKVSLPQSNEPHFSTDIDIKLEGVDGSHLTVDENSGLELDVQTRDEFNFDEVFCTSGSQSAAEVSLSLALLQSHNPNVQLKLEIVSLPSTTNSAKYSNLSTITPDEQGPKAPGQARNGTPPPAAQLLSEPSE